jgi:phospho-N-acetylmuramoyl-pentapeptide-transferase
MPMQLTILLSTFILSVVCGIVLIPVLTRLKFGQVVREDGPQSHLAKMGMPTMGGVIFLIPLAIVCGFLSIKFPQILPVLIVTLLFGLVGFVDDYIKIGLKRSKGLNSRQKMLGLLIIAAGFACYLQYFAPNRSMEISIPFINNWFDFGAGMVLPHTNIKLYTEWAYIPFVILVMLASTNSVNLTDGLDGLASGITMIIMVFFTLVSMAMENTGMILFSSAAAGSCLGFLAFNMHPAKVFMGDTGSLALGGAIAAVGIVMKMPLVIIIVAGVCVIEALSVIIQVACFKMTGKRVFKMAPIHHHLELSGWSENRVVWSLWAVTAVLCFIGLLSLRYSIF